MIVLNKTGECYKSIHKHFSFLASSIPTPFFTIQEFSCFFFLVFSTISKFHLFRPYHSPSLKVFKNTYFGQTLWVANTFQRVAYRRRNVQTQSDFLRSSLTHQPHENTSGYYPSNLLFLRSGHIPFLYKFNFCMGHVLSSNAKSSQVSLSGTQKPLKIAVHVATTCGTILTHIRHDL